MPAARRLRARHEDERGAQNGKLTVLASRLWLQRSRLQECHFPLCSDTVSTVQDIEAAIPRLTRAEVEALRKWIDDYLEDQLELTTVRYGGGAECGANRAPGDFRLPGGFGDRAADQPLQH
jgi:hypothetical protein